MIYEELQAEAVADGASDWVWAMVRFLGDGRVQVSDKLERRRTVVIALVATFAFGCVVGALLAVDLGLVR